MLQPPAAHNPAVPPQALSAPEPGLAIAGFGKRDAAFDAANQGLFSDPKPARATVGSTLKGLLVEIDVMAYAG